ncbi:hypothetical protein BDR03DRAFT_936433 [Suillus americanus]|nr:hypothetical protein BDR03DRAFT_936433 [Suillus americanus]
MAKHHTIEKTRIHNTEATTNSFALKEKGIFTDSSRAMVRNMVATLDVPIWSVNATINAMVEALGVEITGLVNATSHKNINYQSHHVTYLLPDGHAATQFAGILHKVNHKSETQLQGWKSCTEDMYDTYNDVVGSTAGALDVRDFPSKVKGMLTDYAEDQKKIVRLFTEWKQLCEQEEQFDSLPQSKKDDIDFFVWAGCCMHKELNTAKGGNSRSGLLMNKDNIAASSAGSSTAKQRAIQVLTGGAQKVLELVGAVFRHKDDKKGQQDSLRYYFEVELGYRIQWPDISNIWYHSHSDAACDWTSTNIKYNVYWGFMCLKTKQEMMSWATYNQCITHPYLCTIWNPTANILDLGPIHMKVISHLNHIINDIDLILAPDATYKTLTLYGKPFEHPEAFYAIQCLALDRKTYPHFPQLLVTFFQGALDTWI